MPNTIATMEVWVKMHPIGTGRGDEIFESARGEGWCIGLFDDECVVW